MHSLPIFVRLSGQPVILLGDGEMAQAKRRLLERAGAVICTRIDADARIAIVAMAGEAAEAAAAVLRARGLLVNVVDRPDLCDFTTPAIVDRDPVLIAIATGGASAGLAKALRQRLERMLPATLGPLATALAQARDAMRHRWPDPAARRRAIDAALDEGGVLDPLGNSDGSGVGHWLGAPMAQSGATGQVVAILLDSPDPDRMRIDDARLLGQADAIWHDGSVPEAILNRVRADAVRLLSPTAPDADSAGADQLVLWVRCVAQAAD